MVPTMKKFGVGIQLYGVRNAMEADFEGTLQKVKDMGYEYVEFAGYFGHTGEEIKAILDKIGLKCVSVHQGLEFYQDDVQKGIDFLKAFGVKYSVIPWFGKERLAGNAAWEDTKALFNKIAAVLHKNGMWLGYHNHDFEFETFNGKYLHDYIFEAVPAEYIQPELDTCWVHYAGINPADKIRQFKGRVDLVHLKDFVCKNLGAGPVYDLIDKNGKAMKAPSKEDNGFEFCPLGRGRQNFAEILAACEECGTEVVIVEQDKTYGGMSELEAAEISRNYLRDTFGL
ncbi:MAG: sugar phosphate isomerase/epimerase [Clostridia bacterium]|nr:sugar phosphate isomerase/epimerase [Clostridia bacterium]